MSSRNRLCFQLFHSVSLVAQSQPLSGIPDSADDFPFELLRKQLDHFRVLNIAALSGHRHHKCWRTSQATSCVSREFSPWIRQNALHPEHREWSGRRRVLGDIVKQRGDENQLS